MATIKIQTGIKTYDIEDENGNIRGQISFNPSDLNFFTRAKALIDNISAMIEPLADVDDKTEDEILALMSDTDCKIKIAINELFDDENASNVVFGNQNCMNTLNGVSFAERFLASVMPVIMKDIESEKKKSDEKINKYVSQVK